MNYSLESEQSVLGSILLKSKMFAKVSLIINADDFYEPKNRAVYQAIIELAKKELDIDSITVGDKLRELGLLEISGGAAYISALADCVPTYAHAETYAKTVKDLSVEREYAKVMIAQNTMEDTIKKLDLLYRRKHDTAQHKTEMIYENTQERLEQRIAKGLVKPMKTSHAHLNNTLDGGFRKGCYYVFSGITGSGKTRFATEIVTDMVDNKHSILYVSLELPMSSIEAMYVAKKYNVGYNKFNNGLLDRDVMQDIYADLERQKDNFAITHHMNRKEPMHPNIVEGIVEDRLKCVGSIDLLVVDYITELKLLGYGNSAFELSKMYGEISKRMNDIAVKYDIAVIGLVQTSIPKRGEEGFQMADIGKSKEILEPAWAVAGIVRDKSANGFDLQFVKNRFGSQFEHIKGNFDWYYNTFKELSAPEHKEEETQAEKNEHPF